MAKQLFDGQHEDEEVLEVFRHHPVVLRKGLYGMLGLTTIGMIPAAIWPTESQLLIGIPVGFVIGLLVFFYYWIGWYYSMFILTDQRFIQISQKGLFQRSVVDVGLDKIQNINFQIGGMQQALLKFGTIVVQTFVGDLVLHNMPHPEQIQQEMIRTIKESGIEAQIPTEEEPEAQAKES